MLHRALFVWIIFVGLSIAPAAAKDYEIHFRGIWSTTDSFTQVDLICTRVYTCWGGENIIYDDSYQIVIDTPPKLIRGVCQGISYYTTCDQCLTKEPKEPCEWHLEKKKSG